MPYFIFFTYMSVTFGCFFINLYFFMSTDAIFHAVLSLTTASFRHMLQFSIRADDTPRLELIGTSSPVAAKPASV